MKIWDKGYTIDNAVEQFTVGNDRVLDLHIARFDVLASKAHAVMLAKVGIMSEEESEKIAAELDLMLEQIAAGSFTIEDEFEDVHSKIEHVLIEQLGDTGKKIHTGRSRNDQVLVALHLYYKEEIGQIKTLTKALFEQLIVLSNQHKDKILPGYTHMQVAMPSSFGLWFGGYAESLIDDIILLNAAFRIVDQNPLGSGAGYGSSFPLDRTETTSLLGFAGLKYNSIAAQMSRGKSERTLSYAMASLAGTLAKLAMDICLYMNENYGFITFPKELTTGSSIMPHKKNPDVFELVRGKCNKIQSLPTELTLITNNLPHGYHRDLQLLKESTMPAIISLKDCLSITTFMLEHIRVNDNIMDNEQYRYVYSVENVNRLVNEGMSFRDAYLQIGQEVEKGTFEPQTDLHHTHEGSIGNLCNDEIVAKFKTANDDD
jgi:argininosuccinate lyase